MDGVAEDGDDNVQAEQQLSADGQRTQRGGAKRAAANAVGESYWLHIRSRWTRRTHWAYAHELDARQNVSTFEQTTTTTTTRSSAQGTQSTTTITNTKVVESHRGVQKSVDGGVALDDFLCARSRMSDRVPLADMIAILTSTWEEEGTML